jgi:hypothetical protein
VIARARTPSRLTSGSGEMFALPFDDDSFDDPLRPVMTYESDH